ncbi:dpr-interacting protein lambda [Arctopsyche grandis]|uniref:dpr-interacting protein lambda n=1 Tax=Arctopsyche grandis TaxID=121162 RepID=UPI00406D7BE9
MDPQCKAFWLSAFFTIMVTGQIAVQPEIQPEFLAPLENHTVTQGRDVHFTCVVNHLSEYRVAWIKSDSKAILAINTRMVAINPRLSVTYNGHNTWRLHVANVQANDSGTYMCQINTDPMRSQTGYLKVVIPPDILNEDEEGSGGVALEGGAIRMKCIATGTPEPTVTWKRDPGKSIIFRHENGRERKAIPSHEGPVLHLSYVQRTDMGLYYCIASNGVPPTVSKRYIVQVQFQPLIKVSNQLVAAPLDSDVGIQCYVEASPSAMNSWYRDNGDKIMMGGKYVMSETQLNEYSFYMNLTIKGLERKDLGGYVCASVNALGKVEGSVRLQELQLPAKMTTISVTSEPSRSSHKKPPDNRHKNRGRKPEHKGRHDLTTRSWMDQKSSDPMDLDYSGTRPPWVTMNGGCTSKARLMLSIALLPFIAYWIDF